MNLRLLGFCVVAALCAHASHAQTVYKWTDADGKVHYAEKKDGATSNQQEVKIAPAPPMPPPTPVKPSGPDPWEAAFKKPIAPKDYAAQQGAVPQPQRSVSGGREDGTVASRCNLARDVLNGTLRHGNGAKIDQYDRDVASADVKRFCH